jgi:hypothetical protein
VQGGGRHNKLNGSGLDPDTGAQKLPTKIGKVNKVYFFYFFQLYFFNFWSPKPWIWDRNPDPDSLEMLDAGSGTVSGFTTLVLNYYEMISFSCPVGSADHANGMQYYNHQSKNS